MKTNLAEGRELEGAILAGIAYEHHKRQQAPTLDLYTAEALTLGGASSDYVLIDSGRENVYTMEGSAIIVANSDYSGFNIVLGGSVGAYMQNLTYNPNISQLWASENEIQTEDMPNERIQSYLDWFTDSYEDTFFDLDSQLTSPPIQKISFKAIIKPIGRIPPKINLDLEWD